MTKEEFELILKEDIILIDNKLDELMPKAEELPPKLYEAMRYSLFAGGKRIRPILLLHAGEACGAKGNILLPFACAMEMIHTYSLVHDDLPAMDNDDYRRGKLTNHKVFGDDIAILSGDGLLSFAFEVMITASVKMDNLNSVLAMKEIARGCGVFGMIAGQTADVYYEGADISKEILNFIHLHKTADMISYALRAGSVLSGASNEVVRVFGLIGEYIGMAFQILDDILDVTATTEVLGKPVFSDEKNEKETYVTKYGIEEARSFANSFSKKALKELETLKENITIKEYEFFTHMIEYLTYRSY